MRFSLLVLSVALVAGSSVGQTVADYAKFLGKAAAEPGAMKTPSGLVYTELRAGTGASPRASQTVKVNYRGTLIDGKEFDSSYKRNMPLEFPLDRVIPCWTEGVQKDEGQGESQTGLPGEHRVWRGREPAFDPGWGGACV